MKIFDYLRVVRGGTGLNTIAAGGILYATALDILNRLAPTAANQVLRSTAANALQFAALVVGDLPAHEATHVKGGADDIDSALDARAVALANQGDIPYRALAADTLAALAPGVAGQALLTGGAGANPSFGAPAPAAHKASHEPAGADEVNDIDIGNTGVLLSAHKARHEPGGADPMTVDAIAATGSLRTLGAGATQAKAGNAAPAAHAPTHKDGGADELDVSELAGALGSAGEIPESDGAAVSWVDPDSRYDPKAHHATHESGGADEIKDMELDNALTGADNTGSGILTVDTVGVTVAAGEVLYLYNDGKYYKALATAEATMPGKVLAMEAITADNAGKLLHLGYFRHDAWGFTVGDGTANLLYVSRATAGLVTQAVPATAGDQVQVIGYCISDDEIFFNPCLELVEIPA